MPLTITPIYLGLAALLLAYLSIRVVQLRWRLRVGFGDGGQPALARAIRVQGNCAEYLPLMMMIVAGTELGGAPGWVVHLFGAASLLGRLLHAYGLAGHSGSSLWRVLGMVATFGVLIFGGLGLIAHALR